MADSSSDTHRKATKPQTDDIRRTRANSNPPPPAIRLAEQIDHLVLPIPGFGDTLQLLANVVREPPEQQHVVVHRLSDCQHLALSVALDNHRPAQVETNIDLDFYYCNPFWSCNSSLREPQSAGTRHSALSPDLTPYLASAPIKCPLGPNRNPGFQAMLSHPEAAWSSLITSDTNQHRPLLPSRRSGHPSTCQEPATKVNKLPSLRALLL